LISACQKLSEQFIEKHIDKLDSFFILQEQDLTESFKKSLRAQLNK